MFYRKGSGSSSSGGLGGGSYSYGDFELLRLDIGVSKAIAPSGLKGFLISGGLNIGALIFTKGEVKDSESSGATNYYQSSVKSIYTELDPINISINFEISQRFKLNQRSFVLAGFKTQVETPEGFGTRIGLVETIFLGYLFR